MNIKALVMIVFVVMAILAVSLRGYDPSQRPAEDCSYIFPEKVLITSDSLPTLVGYNTDRAILLLNEGWNFDFANGPKQLRCSEGVLEDEDPDLVYCRSMILEKIVISEGGTPRAVRREATLIVESTGKSVQLSTFNAPLEYHKVVSVVC